MSENENWQPLDGWSKQGEMLPMSSLLNEPRLADGVRGWAFDTETGIYITAIRAEKIGSGHVSKFLDALPKNRRVVIPVVINPRLRGMLWRRGFVEKWEIGEPYQDDIPVMERRPPEDAKITTGARYYDREGNSLDPEAWVLLYERETYRCVRATNVGEYRVSTLWLGIDHNLILAGPPVIFATYVLARPDRTVPHWSRMNAFTERYTTEQAAIDGHEARVQFVCEHLRVDPAQVTEAGLGE